MTTGLSLEVHAGHAGLERLLPEWTALLGPGGGHFYQHPDYFRCYLQHLSDTPERTYFLLLRGGADTLAVLPLEQAALRRGPLALRLLQLPMHHHLSLADGAWAPGAKAETGAGLAQALAEARDLPAWDALRVAKLPAASRLPEALRLRGEERLMARAPRQRAWFGCSDEDALRTRFSGHFRRNLARLRKKAQAQGEVVSEFVRDPQQLPRAFEEFVRLEASGWKGTEGTASAIATGPHLRDFYAALMARFGALGRCQINLLRIGGQYVAGQFCLRDADTLSLLKIGYDEAFRGVGPGALLLEDVLLHGASDSALGCVDLTTAPEWARRWNPHYEPVADLMLFNTTARARVAQAALGLGASLRRRRPEPYLQLET